jgi:hypothetical protein
MAVLANHKPPTDSNWKYYDDEMLQVLKRQYPELVEETYD